MVSSAPGSGKDMRSSGESIPSGDDIMAYINKSMPNSINQTSKIPASQEVNDSLPGGDVNKTSSIDDVAKMTSSSEEVIRFMPSSDDSFKIPSSGEVVDPDGDLLSPYQCNTITSSSGSSSSSSQPSQNKVCWLSQDCLDSPISLPRGNNMQNIEYYYLSLRSVAWSPRTLTEITQVPVFQD